MPDSQNPSSPNFKPGNGRLVLDRYDAESHFNGSSFRHNGTQIDLFPTLVIGSNTATNVQDALELIIGAIAPALVEQATIGTSLSNLGIITLGGDLSGVGSTALIPRIGGIQGRPIQNITPTTGQVLTWNSGGYWYPAPGANFTASGDLSGDNVSQTVIRIQGRSVLSTAPTTGQVLTWNGTQWGPATAGTFTAGGDLSGTSSSQQVVAMTGDTTTNPGFHTVVASNDYIQFLVSAQPHITQTYVSGSSGANMIVKAQGVSSGSGNGGDLVLAGGASFTGGGGGLPGKVSLSLGGNPGVDSSAKFMAQIAQVNASANIFAFFPSNATIGITSTDMPSNTGDKVIYIGDTSTPPTIPATTGAILWSEAGVLNVMQEDGTTFPIEAPTNIKAYFGSGVDGYVTFDGTSVVLGLTPVAGTYTLTRNISCIDLTINTSVTIKTHGWLIMCTGTLTVNGTIDNSGSDVSDNTQAAGAGASWSWLGGGSEGGDGYNAPQNGVNFNNFNVGFGGIGGSAEAVGGDLDNSLFPMSAANLSLDAWLSSGIIISTDATTMPVSFKIGGGSGGSGGEISGAIPGGGGGGGAGVIVIASNKIVGTGAIQAIGGNGSTITSGSFFGGGAGGGGGVIVLIYGSKTGSLTTSVSGGLGGTTTVVGAHPGGNGQDGTVVLCPG